MIDDIVINKIQSIQRCVVRAREEYAANQSGFTTDFTRQDAAVLNILRACEQAIDLANHLISLNKLGIPNTSAESFDLLAKQEIISVDLAGKLKKMTAFRNTVVHQYQVMNVEIVKAVVISGLDDLILFGDNVKLFVQTRK